MRERMADAHLARRLGVWLQDEAHARRLVVEAVRILKAALNKVSDDDVRTVATDVLLPRLAQEPAGLRSRGRCWRASSPTAPTRGWSTSCCCANCTPG